MNFNYEKARELMVEKQLRPNKIKDINILNIFSTIPKESFLPEELELLSYSDMDISLSQNRGYLKNLHLAQLIKHSNIEKNHKILHIGALTGYFTCILSNLCSEVFAIEDEAQHLSTFKKYIKINEIKNINLVKGSFREGDLANAPFDRIIIDCPMVEINEKLLNQLHNNLGQLIMIEKNKENLSKAIKITKNSDSYSREYLFDVFSTYELYREKEGFIF